MRTAISILPCLLYLSLAFRSAYPLLEYELNKDYIAQALCINKDKPQLQCNGHCHLKKQIEQANREQEEGKAPAQKTMELFVLLPNCIRISAQAVFFSKISIISKDKLPSATLPGIFHPPKV